MGPHYLIDKEELLNFPTEDYSGFCNFVYDLIQKHDFLGREDGAMDLAKDIFDGIMNIIETAEVVEERKSTICSCFTTMPGDYPIYHIFVESAPNGQNQIWTMKNINFVPIVVRSMKGL